MPRKKQRKIPLSAVKFIIAALFASLIGYGLFAGFNRLFLKSDYFAIKTIYIDPALGFINRYDVEKLKGKNLFTVDLKEIEKKLSYKYPQVSQLKINKQFPNQISIVAKKKLPFAQTVNRKTTLTIDKEGIILSKTTKRDKRFPLIQGLKVRSGQLILGTALKGRDIRTALKVMQAFREDKALTAYDIQSIDVTNLSKIVLTLDNDLDIYMDWDKVSKKIKILGLVMVQGQIDLKSTKYIDLRFKEPILGKK